MALFYADENVPISLVTALRVLGHDVLTALEDGKANQAIPDADLLARAVTLGRTVLTNNRRHFHTLHVQAPNHAGIVTYTDDADRAALAGRIDAAVATVSTLAGVLTKVVRPNRPLPPASTGS
jgi:ABC-type amino acid transport substrate-binding protein